MQRSQVGGGGKRTCVAQQKTHSMCLCVHLYLRTYVCAYICAWVCVFVYALVCVCGCVLYKCECVCMCMHILQSCVPVLCACVCACAVCMCCVHVLFAILCLDVLRCSYCTYHVCPQFDLAARSPQVRPAPVNSEELPLSQLPRTAQGGEKEEGRGTGNEGE